MRLAVISRLSWIRRQRAAFAQQERQSEREFVTGESHYFEGRRYRLKVVENGGAQSVSLRNKAVMELLVRPATDTNKRAAVVHRWYRERMKQRLPGLIAKWEPKVGVAVVEVSIKRMKTRWGSCNDVARRIWLNLELAKKPALCLEYIFVHEMVHMLERHHNERFMTLMDELMPTWRLRRDELNRTPLAHEEWRY